jgi:hypothetical protein
VLRVSRVVYLEGKVGVGCAEGEQGEQDELNGQTRQTL